MELIYLYIGDVGRPLKNQEFRFGNRWKAAYEATEKTLRIGKPNGGDSGSLYGDNILSLNLLLGRNGTGKSTVLKLLGYASEDRMREFPHTSKGNEFPYSSSHVRMPLGHRLPTGDFWSYDWKSDGAKTEHSWFALYHLGESGTPNKEWFALEGYRSACLNFLDKPEFQEGGNSLRYAYSVAFLYDFGTNEASNIQQLQKWTRDPGKANSASGEGDAEPGNRGLFYILLHKRDGLAWLQDDSLQGYNDKPFHSHLFPRLAAHETGYAGVVRYLCDSLSGGEAREEMESSPGASMELAVYRDIRYSVPGKQYSASDAGNLLYRDGKTELLEEYYISQEEKDGSVSYSEKERMALGYLEETALDFIFSEEVTRKNDRNGREDPAAKEKELELAQIPLKSLSYQDRKGYLLGLIRYFSSDADEESEYYQVVKEIIAGIEAIDAGEAQIQNMRCYVSSMDKASSLLPLMEALDHMRYTGRPTEILEGNSHALRVRIHGMSDGEAQFIDFYAFLYSALVAAQYEGSANNSDSDNDGPLRSFITLGLRDPEERGQIPKPREGDTCALLLDEPDARFHPEWSRRFIRNLNRLLNPVKRKNGDFSDTERLFRRYRYQIVIASHSPLLAVDVPRQDIQCLWRNPDNGEIAVKDSPHGFMSSLYDMLTDSFFLSSVFGAFAEERVNEMFAEIEALETSARNGKYDPKMEESLRNLRGRAAFIEDSVISHNISVRLKWLEDLMRFHPGTRPADSFGGEAGL